MRAKRADGRVEPRLCYLPSTPQSPRGDSSPSGEPFGILQPPSQSCPRLRESCTKCRKGNGLEMLTAASYSPPQLRLRSAAPPHAVAPFGALYKLIHKQQRGRIASPYLHNLLCSPAAKRISHCASNISLRISAISPVRKNGFHRGRKPPTSPFLPGQRSGSRRPPRCRW